MATDGPNLASTYEYVIVGGGIGGITLAARLHARLPEASILVLEAGSDPSTHELATSASTVSAVRSNADLTWQLPIEPCKGLGNRSSIAQVGKGLSGSGAVNSAAWTRGPACDYDLWAHSVGDQGWSYESLLPYFKATECVRGMKINEDHHGYEGLIHVVPVKANWAKRTYPLRKAVQEAWAQSGVDYIEDGNAGDPLGLTELVEAWDEGKRQLPSKSFDLEGVDIVTDTLVHRVTFTQDQGHEPRAKGVELISGQHINATKEVIVSAGVYHTPKILILSGIGDPQTLVAHSIPLVHGNPEVGNNLRDHLSVALTWKLKHPEIGLALGSPLLTDPSYANGAPLDFIQFGRVPTNLHTEMLLTSKEDKALVLRPKACHTESILLYTYMGPHMSGVNVPMDGTYITTVTANLAPTSRGHVSIHSKDPQQPPKIDVNANDTEVDRHILREGLRNISKVLHETPSGQSFIDSQVPPEGYPVLLPDSKDEAYDVRIRDFGFTLDHPMGTAAMGKVVDASCRVIGVNGLRVVDASVFPVPIAAHIQVAVYALAARAADLIAKEQ
ncbi:hypothetical protein LTS18_000077 [Coniosporium uncinatum]|uniref:Uncharacterized protein n=1 Tax=Coniosporium uncinatum TaxID=93489 RepID=A0ACC3DDS4_9PEZI|nr:hypothetical protein LTS18_000077 [Coniosporium uncinatum]